MLTRLLPMGPCDRDPQTDYLFSTGFKRFPAWMWRKTVVLDCARWLRAYNDAQPPTAKVGFYGIDLYSLSTSMAAVLTYLDKVDPDAAQRARYCYACFDQFGEDT